MKHSIKGLFVILAIVVSFVFVQGVWADKIIVEVKTITGTVDSVGEETRSIILDTGDTISHLGPSRYWIELLEDDIGSVIETGDELKIDAVYLECLGEYVGVSICVVGGDCIQLRNEITLKPLWNQNAKSTDLSETAVETTGDCEPNDPKDNNWDYNNSHYYKGPGSHGGNDF